MIPWLKRVTCATFGHSRIVTQCFGYIHCGRCQEQIGDGLASVAPPGLVLIEHDCETCRKNARDLKFWRDRFLTPDPKVTCEEAA